MASSNPQICLTLEQSIRAFEARIGDITNTQTATEARIGDIAQRYGLYDLPYSLKNYALPTASLLQAVRNTAIPVTEGAQTLSYSLSELDRRLASYTQGKTRQAAIIDSSKTNIASSYWNFFGLKITNPLKISSRRDQKRIAERATREKEILSQEETIFIDARNRLAPQISEAEQVIKHRAASDLEILKTDLAARPELAKALYHATTVQERLQEEQIRPPPHIQMLEWPTHPQEMSFMQLHFQYNTISSMLDHEREQIRHAQQRENSARIFDELLNHQSIEDIKKILCRGTSFNCSMREMSPFRFMQCEQLPDDKNFCQEFQFQLEDSNISRPGTNGSIPVFHAHLFWFPNQKMMGIVSVHTAGDFRGEAIGRVAVRNIFDFARSLDAERVDLLAGEESGPLFWAKCGAALQPEGKKTSDMRGSTIDDYFGRSDDIAGRVDICARILKIYDYADEAETAKWRVLAQSETPEQALWAIADNKTMLDDGRGGKTSVGAVALTTPKLMNYAARFELNPGNADPSQTARMNTYLSPDLTVDESRYAAHTATLIEKFPQRYHYADADVPRPDFSVATDAPRHAKG